MSGFHRRNRKAKVLFLFSFLILALVYSNAQTGLYKERISSNAAAIEQKVIEWRRDFHANPELGNFEFRTAEIVANHLKALGMEVQTGIAITGVKGILKGKYPGPVIALRADMDALPVTERVDVPFASKVKTIYNDSETGVMHACGHDAHVAILMGVAEILAGMKDELKGTVVFIFQPAEEGAPEGEEGGAELMVKEGVLKNPDVDVIFGLHMGATRETGKLYYRPGTIMAGACDFKIKVHGKPSHGSTPWTSVDPVVTSAQIVNNLQTIVSRNVNLIEHPAVVTVGTIHGGNRFNIIPEEVEMTGTIRVFSEADEHLTYTRLQEIAENTGKAAGADVEVQVPNSVHYPVTHNDETLTAKMLPTLVNAAGEGNVKEINPITGAEDFSFYANEVPGLFFFLGARPVDTPKEEAAPHHTPEFFLDESSFITGVKALSNLVTDYMEIEN